MQLVWMTQLTVRLNDTSLVTVPPANQGQLTPSFSIPFLD